MPHTADAVPDFTRLEWLIFLPYPHTSQPVYSEKPMGGSPQELKALLDQFEAKGVQFMDGTM